MTTSTRVRRGSRRPGWIRGLALTVGLTVGPIAVGPAAARLVYDANGQVTELVCDPAAIADDERIACGAESPTWTNVHDARGRLARQVLHDGGRLVSLREFAFDGSVAFDETRELVPDDRERVREGGAPREVVQLRRRTYGAGGVLQRETVHVDGRPRSVGEFDETGSPRRLTTWNAREERSLTEWYPDRVLARQEWPAVYEGRAARMVQDYWPSGQIRTRGTIDAKERRLGLFQTFHPGAGVASESFYVDGRLTRLLEFGRDGRLMREETYRPDGSVQSSMRR